LEVDSNSFEKKSRDQSEFWWLSNENGRFLSPGEIQAVFDFTPAGIGIIRNRVLYWTNDNLCSMLGHESNCLIGKNTRNFYADQQEYERVGIDLYSKLDIHDKGLVETKLVKKDGTFLHCRIRVSRLQRDLFSLSLIFQNLKYSRFSFSKPRKWKQSGCWQEEYPMISIIF
jgi:two-component system cell cycle sensor histidine kinase/response regulator CckA